MLLTSNMYSMKAFFVFCANILACACLHGITYPSGGNGSGTANNPIFSGTEDADLIIYLDGNLSGSPADSFSGWKHLSPSGPTAAQGEIPSGIENHNATHLKFTFDPTTNFEGNATFSLESREYATDNNVTHNFIIEMSPTNDTPQIKFNNGSGGNFETDGSYSIDENLVNAGFLYIKEFDSTDDVNITLDPSQLNNLAFEQPVEDTSYVPPDPDFPNEKKYVLAFKSAKDYESQSVIDANSQFKLKIWARDGNTTSGDVNQTLTVTISPLDEPPSITPIGPVDFSVTEDKSGDVDGSFYRQKSGYFRLSVGGKDRGDPSVNFKLSSLPTNGKVFYSTTNPGAIAPTAQLTGATVNLTTDQIWIDYRPDDNQTGSENFTIQFLDEDDVTKYSDIVFSGTIVSVTNDWPFFSDGLISPHVVSFAEEQVASVGIIDLNASDGDSEHSEGGVSPNGDLRFTLSGDDKDFFNISTTGVLTFKNKISFEDKLDADNDNSFNVTVRVTDPESDLADPTNYEDLDIVVNLTNVNEQPQIIQGTEFALTGFSISEGGTWALPPNWLKATDVDADDNASLTWVVQFSQGGALSGGSVGGTHDNPTFTYVPLSDYPNLSAGTDTESLTITVKDVGGFASDPLIITATINALPDAPEIILLQRGSERVDINATAQRVTFSYPENSVAADPIRISVNEVDGQDVSFELLDAGNQDVNFFTITDLNESISPYKATLSFTNNFIPNYEDPQDSNFDNNYSVRIRAKETNNTNSFDDLFIDILITDQDESPNIVRPDPVDIDSRGDTYTDYNITMNENQKFITTMRYKDPDQADANKSFTWNIVGGVDEDYFEVNASTGVLSFKDNLGATGQVGINYENKLDLDLNNTYEVEIKLIDPDGGGSATKNFHIKIEDVNDPAVVGTPLLSLLEPAKTNSTFQLSQYVSDEDNRSGLGADTITWGLKEVSSVFKLEQDGSLSFQAPSDYESNQTSFSLVVQAFDGTTYVDANFSIQVNEDNEPPEFFDDLNNTLTFIDYTTPEEITIPINLSQFTKDPENDPVTFSHNYDSSNGQIKFFNPSNGTFDFIPSADFSGLIILDFNASDPSDSRTPFKVNIKVTEVPDPPVVFWTGVATQLGFPNTFLRSILENNGTLVADLNASDPNDNPSSTNFIWTLSGSDASKFKMNPPQGSTSKLEFLQVPNFEANASADGDSIYDFNMTVQDDGNATIIPVRVTVIDGAEDPYFDYGDGNQTVTFVEDTNGTVFDVNVSDYENSPITYGLTGNGTDDANFSINSNTGVITFNSPPDYEDPWGGSETNATNSYILEVNATDDAGAPNKIKHFVIVNVINVIEAPQFQGVFTKDIGENFNGQSSQFDINVTTEDVNQSLILEILGGADADKFSLNVATKNLYFSNPNGQDYEDPASVDGDNSYEVQVGIVGTNVTQDFVYTVINGNDIPTISTSGLTQLTSNENVPFVIDIDVLDQDGGGMFPDLLYTIDGNSTRFIEHNSSGLAVSNLYKSPSTGMVDNSLSGAIFSTAGDLNNDGDLDVITLTTSAIHYHEGYGTGSFDRNTTTVIDDALTPAGTPDHAVICDLDQDGDQDLIVTIIDDSRILFYRNIEPVGTFDAPIVLVQGPAAGKADFITVGDMDGDYDLDLVVAFRDANEVVWYANNGSINPTFSQGGVVATSINGFEQPRYLEILDANNSSSIGNRFQSPDVLIAAKGGIYLAANGGNGTFSTSKIVDIDSNLGLVVRAVNLDGNRWPDLVYATSGTGPPSYLLQGPSGYAASPLALPNNTNNASWTIDTPTAIEIYTGPSIPPLGYSGPTPTTPAIIVSDSAQAYISIFSTTPSQTTGVQVGNPFVLNAASGISSLMLADLNRKKNFITYAFDPILSTDFNATRFKNEGMLFFNSPYPNYEQPTDSSKINRYKVWITADDKNGTIAKELVTVKILDVNEPPVIITLDGNATSIIEHVENLTSVIDVNVTHEENATQTVVFSVAGGADQAKFSIDQASGELFFRIAPDFEANGSADGNNSYEVLVRVIDNGNGAAYDEQHIQVRVIDGNETPEFNASIITTLSVVEDNSIPLGIGTDINASDPNSGGGIDQFQVLTNGMHGNATIINNVFSYTPDGNYTGSDSVVLEVNNTAGLKDTLTLNFTVTPVNDPPSILSSPTINHPENKAHVISLVAVDDNNATLTWSWSGGVATDSDFLLTSDGNLTFRKVPDYETGDFNNTYNKLIQVSDGENQVDGNFTINVNNLNDNAPKSLFLIADASSSFSLLENKSVVVDFNASDPDNSIIPTFNTVTYTISGGPDSTRFDVSTAGRLQLLPTPDFENPDSADLDNIYMVDLTLSDGGFSQIYPIVVTVTDADENNPTIISKGGLTTVTHVHPENQLAVLQVVATDIEPNPLVYSIYGGADDNLFYIDSSSGQLSFKIAPDFESRGDADGNNLYEVWVKAKDTGNTDDNQTIHIKLTDVDELPTVSPSLFNLLEDTPTPISFTVADPEGGTATFSVITPPVNGEWTGSGNSFTYTPDAHYHGSDSVTLRVSDGTSQFDTLVNLEISATNDPPTAVNDEFFYNDVNFGTLYLDVLANDSNAPDQNGTETLSLTSFSQPGDGNVSLAIGATSFSFTPSESFIGITTFNYTVWDGSYLAPNVKSESNGTVEIVVSRASSLPSWRFLKKFGYYNQTEMNWIYHNDLGWLYLDDVAGVETFTWMWHEDMGWFWTGNTYFPDLYLNDLARWMSWKGSRTTGANWTIYDQVNKIWMDSEKFKVARLNLIFSQLKNVDQVMDFVNSSTLFTEIEKKRIASEFFVSGKSTTLTSKGFTLVF